jgi:dolichol kinase
MLVFFMAAAYFLTLFIGIEFIARKTSIPKELSRKLAHIIAGVSAAFLPSIMPFSSIVILAVVFLIVMILSRHFHLFKSIHDVKRHSYGELFFPVAIGLMALLFPEAMFYTYGILVMAIADGLAGLLGAQFGRKVYRLGNAKKSCIGSAVFFVTCSAIGWIIMPHIGIFAIALVLTLVEAASTKGVDNLLLPPIAAMLLMSIQ